MATSPEIRSPAVTRSANDPNIYYYFEGCKDTCSKAWKNMSRSELRRKAIEEGGYSPEKIGPDTPLCIDCRGERGFLGLCGVRVVIPRSDVVESAISAPEPESSGEVDQAEAIPPTTETEAISMTLAKIIPFRRPNKTH